MKCRGERKRKSKEEAKPVIGAIKRAPWIRLLNPVTLDPVLNLAALDPIHKKWRRKLEEATSPLVIKSMRGNERRDE